MKTISGFTEKDFKTSILSYYIEDGKFNPKKKKVVYSEQGFEKWDVLEVLDHNLCHIDFMEAKLVIQLVRKKSKFTRKLAVIGEIKLPLAHFRPYTPGTFVDLTVPFLGTEDYTENNAKLTGQLRICNLPTFIQMEKGFNDNLSVIDAVQPIIDAEMPKIPIVILKSGVVSEQFNTSGGVVDNKGTRNRFNDCSSNLGRNFVRRFEAQTVVDPTEEFPGELMVSLFLKDKVCYTNLSKPNFNK